jgi:hypothetical protein
MGKKQELQLRTWAAELEKSTTMPFPAEPDVWYHMKLRVDARATRRPSGEGWKKDETEPTSGRSRSRIRCPS